VLPCGEMGRLKSARSSIDRVISGCWCDKRVAVTQRAMAGPMRFSRVEQMISPILRDVAAIVVRIQEFQ